MKSTIEPYLPPEDSLPCFCFVLPELQYPSRMNLSQILLDKNYKERGGYPAILYRNTVLTYKELSHKVNRLADSLLKMGIRKWDRVMLRIPNSPEFIISQLAVNWIGAISVPTMPLLKARELLSIENAVEPRAVIVGSGLTEEVEKARARFKSIQYFMGVNDETSPLPPGYIDFRELIDHGRNSIEPDRGNKDDPVLVLHTSGTTGLPKGALHVPSGLLGGTDVFGKYCLQLRKNDVIGGHPSMAFAYGNYGLIMLPFRFGITSSIIDSFRPEKMFETVEKHKITILFSVPTAYRTMLSILPSASKRFNLHSLRLLVSAGETMNEQLYYQLKELLPQVDVLEHIGCTESYAAICSSRPGMVKPGSMGVAAPGVEVKIFDEKGEECPPFVPGLLAFKGPMGFRYWGDPERQKQTVRKGWNYTGDVAYKDTDGFFWYISRSDDVIKSAAYRIAPQEVEMVINEHRAVQESAVVGLPDRMRGQRVKAFLVLRPGYEATDRLGEELKRFVKERIASYKVPREIEFVSSLPRTETGKLQRARLRDRTEKTEI